MEEVSTGAMVPAGKTELKVASSGFTSPEFGGNTAKKTTDDKGVKVELDKELLCPICMQIIEDAFLTACGHSFCYMCIITHLNNKNDCPCCGNSLSTNQLFPNFLLDKLLKKASARQISKTASPIEQFRQALHKGCEVSVKELDTLLSLLSDRKRKLEQEEAERNMQILLDFLHCLSKQKVDELKEIQTDLQFVKEDINVVEQHRIDLYRARDKYSAKLQMFADDSTAMRSRSSSIEKNSSSLISSSRNVYGGMYTGNFQYKKVDRNTQVSALGPNKNDGFSISNSQHMSQSGFAVMRKKRVHSQVNLSSRSKTMANNRFVSYWSFAGNFGGY